MYELCFFVSPSVSQVELDQTGVASTATYSYLGQACPFIVALPFQLLRTSTSCCEVIGLLFSLPWLALRIDGEYTYVVDVCDLM